MGDVEQKAVKMHLLGLGRDRGRTLLKWADQKHFQNSTYKTALTKQHLQNGIDKKCLSKSADKEP